MSISAFVLRARGPLPGVPMFAYSGYISRRITQDRLPFFGSRRLLTPLRRYRSSNSNYNMAQIVENQGKYYPHKIERAHNDSSLVMNHTCLRIKDPKVSVAFYERHFGMSLYNKVDFPEMKFSLYFLGFRKPDAGEEAKDVFSKTGMLELTHNWGSESDPSFTVNNGNEEPHRGFGHICFSMENLEQECNKLESDGVSFKKRMSDGRQHDIAFALDPDGYWIELLQYNGAAQGAKSKIHGHRFNHTMIRVKDPQKSREFYENVLGMKLLRTLVQESAQFTLYFFGYPSPETDDVFAQEGVIELTHNWGSENDDSVKYHTGNSNPQGYGHTCVSCKDPKSLCDEIEKVYGDKINWGLKFNKGKINNIGFIQDPDGYSIEVIPHGLKV